MIKSFLCANAIMIFCFIIDAILIIGAVALLVWYLVKGREKTKAPKVNKEKANKVADTGATKVNDDTYVLETEQVEPEPEQEPEPDNAVVHFVNQISDINEETNNELNENAVIVNHEVEQAEKKIVKKEEIENYVIIAGEKKKPTETEKVKSINRGTNAFKNSSNFINVINSEQSTGANTKVNKKK